MQSEKQIEKAILYWMNFQRGCFAFKYDVKGTWDPKGQFFRKAGGSVALGGADIIFIFNGLFGCFEVKTPQSYNKFFRSPGAHELRQQAFLQQVRSKGGLAEVVCSLDQVMRHLKSLDNSHEKVIKKREIIL